MGVNTGISWEGKGKWGEVKYRWREDGTVNLKELLNDLSHPYRFGFYLARASDPLERLISLLILIHSPWNHAEDESFSSEVGITYWVWESEKIKLELA